MARLYIENEKGCYVKVHDTSGFQVNGEGFSPVCDEGFSIPTTVNIPQSDKIFRLKDVDLYTFMVYNGSNDRTPHVVNSVARHYEDGKYEGVDEDGNHVLLDKPFTKRYMDLVKPLKLHITVDGWYSVVNMQVPTSEWLVAGLNGWIVPYDLPAPPTPIAPATITLVESGFKMVNGYIEYVRHYTENNATVFIRDIYLNTPIDELKFRFDEALNGDDEFRYKDSVLSQFYTNGYFNDIKFGDAGWDSEAEYVYPKPHRPMPARAHEECCSGSVFYKGKDFNYMYGPRHEWGHYDSIRSGIFYSENHGGSFYVNYMWATPVYPEIDGFVDDNAIPTYWQLHIKRIDSCELITYKFLEHSTLVREQAEFISLCNLIDCWLGLSKKLMAATGPCLSPWDENKQLRYRRDVVKMSLDVIRYMTEQICDDDYSEIQKTIESLAYCGLCTGLDMPKTRSCNCSALLIKNI